MVNSPSNWQDSLNQELVNRLTRPLRQPGMMKMAMSQRIINRCDRFLNRLPLLSQQMQRWGNTNTLSSENLPIVYAQPVALKQEQKIDNSQPIVSQNQPASTIQRKLDSSQSLPIATVNNSIPIQNNITLSNSNFADPTTPLHNLEIPINQPAITSSEIPIVSPQSIAEDLFKTEEMPLPDKLTESQIFISKSNLNPPPKPILDAIQTKNVKYTLRASARQTLCSSRETRPRKCPPLREINHPINTQRPILDEIKTINQTTISSSEIPVVLPQPIAEDLSQEFANISDEQLPIIQAKIQNYSLSQSSLPIVNHLNTFASPKQTQQNMYSENENLLSPNSSINSQNYQNRSVTILDKQTVNISPLPLVSVTSPANPSLKPQSLPLPLAKTTPSSKSINQQPNLSNRNSTSTIESSTIRTFPPTETSVSPIATQSHIDVDTIANQVERKLMRKLVIESERRGKNRWH